MLGETPGGMYWRYSVKKGVLKNCAKFIGKYLSQSLTDLRPATLLKKRLWHRVFPVSFAKFLRTSFLQNTSVRLLLKLTKSTFANISLRSISIFKSFSSLLTSSYSTAKFEIS